ncbi:E3 ubiquitin-protein ligase HERC2-like [Planoprotostelium fungivorum]|uniref:E3 ubiquitin-protein ligase HERC2-like n=1 Tax=Planoprotostelium fungivorum TaxID=1890364 RepID=A0A2P6NNK1_9EUKA|nr:E3 ubiquitin-protein ligase HERC2-like [Planoprotostelium fungivorum]
MMICRRLPSFRQTVRPHQRILIRHKSVVPEYTVSVFSFAYLIIFCADNHFGQLGRYIENASSDPNPGLIGPLCVFSALESPIRTNFIDVASGPYHNLAITEQRKVIGWGRCAEFQIPDSIKEKDILEFPNSLPSLNKMKFVGCRAMEETSLFLNDQGRVYTCGSSTHGECGLGEEEKVEKIKISWLGSGSNHAVAVTEYGDAFSWGENTFGQLALGDVGDQRLPKKISLPGNVRLSQSFCSYDATCLFTTDGDLGICGNGTLGQLGNDSTDSSHTPVDLFHLHGKDIFHVACGISHLLALSEDGDLYGWGYNGTNQLGTTTDGMAQTVPVLIDVDGKKVLAAWAAGGRSFAKTEDGLLYSWGFGGDGALGHGDLLSQPRPKVIEFFRGKDVAAVVGGDKHTLVIVNQSATEEGYSTKMFDTGVEGEGEPGNRPERQLQFCKKKVFPCSITPKNNLSPGSPLDRIPQQRLLAKEKIACRKANLDISSYVLRRDLSAVMTVKQDQVEKGTTGKSQSFEVNVFFMRSVVRNALLRLTPRNRAEVDTTWSSSNTIDYQAIESWWNMIAHPAQSQMDDAQVIDYMNYAQRTDNTVYPLPTPPLDLNLSSEMTECPFRLVQQLKKRQRKSYDRESRFLSPRPVVCLSQSHPLAKSIKNCLVTVQLADEHGNVLPESEQKHLLGPHGKSTVLTLPYLQTSAFALKLSWKSEEMHVRLCFTIEYTTDDGQRHSTILLSDDFHFVRTRKRSDKSEDDSDEVKTPPDV